MPKNSFRRFPCLLILAAATPARAIIRYADGDPTSHTTAPGPAADPNQAADLAAGFANSGWQYMGYFPDKGDATALPGIAIGPHAFITAQHLDNSAGTDFIYNGVSYPITPSSVYEVPGRDMAVFTIAGTFPTWAPLYNANVDGWQGGKTAVLIGPGTQRGTPINANTDTTGTGTLRGWNWGTDDRVQRWGTNVVSGFGPGQVTGSSTEYINFNFDKTGLADEAMISDHDSGGGVFMKGANGDWKLAGVITGGYANYKLAPSDPNGQAGAIFDYRNLYYLGTDGSYHNYNTQPQYAQASVGFGSAESISDVLTNSAAASQLTKYLPMPADANLDGRINALDFNALAANYGMTSGAMWTQGDFNQDGNVNTADFSMLASNFGKVDPSLIMKTTPVPEPAALLVRLCLCLSLMPRHRQNRNKKAALSALETA